MHFSFGAWGRCVRHRATAEGTDTWGGTCVVGRLDTDRDPGLSPPPRPRRALPLFLIGGTIGEMAEGGDTMNRSVDQSIRIGKIILSVMLGYLAFLAVVTFLLPCLPLAVIAVSIGLFIKYRTWRDWLFSTDRSVRIGDIILFVVLGLLALSLVGVVLSPSPHQVGGMSDFMIMWFLSPVAAVAVIIGLIKYRLWRNWLFWALLVIILAIFVESQKTFAGGGSRSDRIVAALLAPLVAVPLWQLVMAISMAVSRKRELGG